MYVIYPADELILMTYGFFAPRVKPRPTLDCLREPQVPIEIPERSLPKNKSIKSSNPATIPNSNPSSAAAAIVHFEATPPIAIQDIQGSPVSASPSPPLLYPGLPSPTSPASYPGSPPVHTTFFNFEEPPTQVVQNQSQSLPPTPTRRTSRASLTHNNSHNSSQRSSLRRNHHMYNDGNNASGSGRAPFQRSSAGFEEQELGAAAIGYGDHRSRSPSIFLEPPTPDPTHAHFGPGWGRPMSPMDLPPEKSFGSSSGSKSPTGKSRLRPKLHLPLGRLGRSTSSETKESNRLREDVHVHVENPVFSSENLRQNNFDAFFEAREPVIKVQPRTPGSAPTERGYSPPLENYAGVYDSPRTRSPTGKGGSGAGSGSLFARTPREERERMAAARSRSADHCDGAGGGGGAVASGSTSAGGGGGGSTSGAHSKGDRFFGKIFKWSKKS